MSGQKLLDDRDLNSHVSTLSGYFSPSVTDKVRHVVTGAEGAVVDGVTITDGRAVGGTFNDRCGGLVFINGISIPINKCNFENHIAQADGAGIYVKFGKATVNDSLL